MAASRADQKVDGMADHWAVLLVPALAANWVGSRDGTMAVLRVAATAGRWAVLLVLLKVARMVASKAGHWAVSMEDQ